MRATKGKPTGSAFSSQFGWTRHTAEYEYSRQCLRSLLARAVHVAPIWTTRLKELMDHSSQGGDSSAAMTRLRGTTKTTPPADVIRPT